MQASAIRFLQHLPLFASCSPDHLQQIANVTTEHRYDKGSVLFQRGDPCDGMHVLVYGKIKLTVSSRSGSEKVVEIIYPGQSFGEAIMFMTGNYPVMAQTLEDALVLFVPAAPLMALLDSDPQLARRMLAGLSMRLHGLLQDVASYSLQGAVARVVSYLLQALGEGEHAGAVTLPVNKQVMASRLNLTPETFSRVLQKLSEQAQIVVEGREIHIPDADKLQQLIELT